MSSVARNAGFPVARNIVRTDDFAHTGNFGQFGCECPNWLVGHPDGHAAQNKAERKHANQRACLWTYTRLR